jgi:hypothetical protein
VLEIVEISVEDKVIARNLGGWAYIAEHILQGNDRFMIASKPSTSWAYFSGVLDFIRAAFKKGQSICK